jgi:hypothetical protein
MTVGSLVVMAGGKLDGAASHRIFWASVLSRHSV